MTLGVSLLSVYADMVSRAVQFGVLQFAPPALAALFALALCNRLLSKLLKRTWLSRADLLVVYAMMLTGVLISTRGLVEKLVPPLAYLPYYATRENGLNEAITQHLPAWAVPFSPSVQAGDAPAAIRDYFEKVGPGQPIPWHVWVGPLCAWLVLFGCVIMVFACLATILRRQWMDNEQLRFPLTALPLAIIRDEVEGEPFFRNRTMWLGFAFAAFVFLINGLAKNNPAWPPFVTRFDFNPFFTERPFNQIDSTSAWFSLAAIGFAYFLPTDLLFSLWFFFVFMRVQDVIATMLGGIPTGIVTHNARVFTGYQAAGAYVVLVLAQFRIGWPHFKAVWQTAFGRHKPLDDSGELMSYRTAILGLGLSFLGIILWLSIAGMSPWLAALQMGIYLFFVAMVMSRAVCEAGLLMTETSFLPAHLIALVHPMPSLGATNLSIMAMTNIAFTRDLRGVLLSPLLDNQKMAGELGMKQRSLLLPIASSIVLSAVVSTAFFLYLNYTQGGISLYGYPNSNAGNMYNLAKSQMSASSPPADATCYGGFGMGIVITMLLVAMRARFAWFPFHPLAYAIAPTWAMYVFWFPFFLAWAIKSLVLRFGGINTFRKVAPFMLGLILGEFMTAVFWALGNMLRGWSAPDFPWP